ncbi:SDR family NAD(P)-dependent oxidoreductase [Saccharopolyspora sp. K220]|uniref:SDR family NAD(P)-dependent oxidoreductase n=1 Tax=Saccharopolyspora soli TaxID=2926618 RepID=UPI001F5AF96D|nr:SDR family NAD(P)-dependent oxidoreductase [Saccharopolyspora soli]MCI2420029.1 SDR family NAD(P)-dependent oxidoreductase [Saccharopolyspora soli]
MQVDGAVVVVSGAGSGLGLATARRLGAAGASVGLFDLDAELADKARVEIGDRALAVPVDVTDGTAVEAAVVEVVDRFGAVHICVNCAGVASAAKVVSRGVPAQLDGFARTVAINLVGTFNVTRVAAAAMLRNEPDAGGERGVIVNTASDAAFDGQVGQAAYSASKAGVVGMTLPLARDLAGKGVRVNAVAPGLFATRMVAGMPVAVRDRLVDMILEPKRMGEPDEFAALVEHLVTNRYLNAECIRLDAGQRMLPR